MKSLAHWAGAHRRTAQVLVVLCYVLINILGIGLSMLLPEDPRVAAWLVLAALLIAGVCIASYTDAARVNRFGTRKLRDLSICVATLLFVTGNVSLQLQPRSGLGMTTEVHAALLPVRSATHHHQSLRERLLHVREWYSEQSKGVKIMLIIFTVLLTAAVIFFWAAICCGTICNGLEFLGYFLFFAGTAGAIFGSVRLIQRIIRGGPRTRKTAS